jgi:hypothetical protein
VTGWANHQRLLIEAPRDLTPEQPALQTAPHQWRSGSSSVTWPVPVCIGSTTYSAKATRRSKDRFRMTRTTVPGLPLEDAGWEDDDEHPRDATKLATTYVIHRRGLLSCWTAEYPQVEFIRHRPSGDRTQRRAWALADGAAVIGRLSERVDAKDLPTPEGRIASRDRVPRARSARGTLPYPLHAPPAQRDVTRMFAYQAPHHAYTARNPGDVGLQQPARQAQLNRPLNAGRTGLNGD